MASSFWCHKQVTRLSPSFNIESVFYLAYRLANDINSIWYNCKHDKISVDVVIHVFHSILNVEDTISADFGASSGSWSLSLSRCFLILQYFTSVYKSAIRISIPEIDKAAMQPPSVHVLPEMRHNLTIEILKFPTFPKIAEMYPRGYGNTGYGIFKRGVQN